MAHATVASAQPDRPAATRAGDRVGWGLLLVWALLLPVQIPAFGADAKRGIFLALSDVVLVVVVLVTPRAIRLRPGMWSGWHAAFPVALAISALLGGALTRYTVANKIIGALVLLAGYALVTSLVTSWERLHAVLRAFLAGTVGITAVTAAARLVDVTLPGTTCHSPSCIRLTGYFHDANLFGALTATALAVHLATIGTPARLVRGRLATVASVAVLATGLLMSLSRSSWIGMALVVAALLVTRGGGSRAVVVTGLVAVGTVAYVIAEHSDRLTRTATRSHTIDSRIEIIRHAWEAFGENPAFGIGLGNFAGRYDAIVHNTFLWLAAELGVVGLILVSGLIGWVSVRLVRAYRATRGPERSLVLALGLAHGAMLTFSLGVEALYQRHWWMVMGLIVAADRLQRA